MEAPGGDAAVLRLAAPGLPASSRGLALSTDSNPDWCSLDPRPGTAATVAESALNVACGGARPVAVVNCLNFGNPEHPEVMWQLSESIDGMSEACLALGLPVMGGNVSLYNESAGTDIDPTPVIGTAGPDRPPGHRPPGVALVEGGIVARCRWGATRPQSPSLAGSRWAVECRGHRNGTLPPLDLALHGRLVSWVGDLVGDGAGRVDGDHRLVAGIHDVSGGGIGVALAEMAVRSGVGFAVGGIADHGALFAEAPSRVVVCTDRPDELIARAADAQLGVWVLGSAGGDRLVVDGLVDVSLDEATTAWRDRLPALLDELAPAGA